MFLSSLSRGYFVVPLSESALGLLAGVAHRKTQIAIDKKTETHKHKLFSFYIAEKMDALQTSSGNLPLPPRALVVVLPFVTHGWTNEHGATNDCYVHDLSPMHKPHIIVN